MKDKQIDLVLVDDHNLFREGIKYILSQITAVNVVGEAANGEELVDLLTTIELPDVILLDINMPIMDGIEACTVLCKKYSKINIIALSMNDEQEYYFKMIQAGAKGFVLKQAGKEELEKAIKEVLSGGSYFPEDILRKIILKFGTEDSVENQIENKYALSKREKEVLALLCKGYTNAEIGEKLFLSHKTIEGYRTSMLAKTGTKNSAHLVMFAIQKGILKV